MGRTFTLMLAAGLLAGCQKPAEVEAHNVSAAEVAQKVRDAAKGSPTLFRAGLWSSTVALEELSAPGMPKELTDNMKSSMGQQPAQQSCLTEEQAKRPSEDFFTGKNNQCRYDNFTMGGGKVEAKMRCDHQGMAQVMEMSGIYSPERYAVSLKTRMEGASMPGGMTMRMRIDAKRIGDCTKQQS